MELRKFGNSDLMVSVLGYGAGHIGSAGLDEKYIERFLNLVIDRGINLIDTARGYGLSEERIGKYLSTRREEFYLSTKLGYGIDGVEDWTYDCIVRGVDYALKLLNTDYIDIVHLHSCPSEILHRGDVVEALQKCKDDGKIRLMAYSGDNESLDTAIGMNRFDSVETSINICDQRFLNLSLEKIKDKGLGVIAKRPLANAPWRFDEQPHGHYCEEYWKRLKKMNLDFKGLSPDEISLRFVLSVPFVSTAIVGTTNVDNLERNIKNAEKLILPGDIYTNILDSFNDNNNSWIGQV